MQTANLILPLIMIAFYMFRYFSKKEKMNIIVYFFFATYPFVSSNGGLPFFESINLYLIIFGIIIYVIQFLANKKNKIIINPYMFLLIFAIALSRYNAEFFGVYTSGMTNFLFVLLSYFYLSNSIKYEEYKGIIDIYKINGFVLSIYAIIEFLSLHDRVSATYNNPNYFAYYMLIAYLFQFYYGKRKISLMLIAISILFSQSRAAIIALIVPFILMKKLKFRYYVITTIAICGSYFSGLLDRFVNSAGSDNDRTVIYSAAREMIKDHPILGIGFNNFAYSFQHYAKYVPNVIGRDIIVTHNDFLKIFTELGLVGMTILILYFINSFNLISKLDDRNKMFAYSACIATCVFCATHNYMGSIEFWMFTSIGYMLKFPEEGLTDDKIYSNSSRYSNHFTHYRVNGSKLEKT